MCIPHLVAYSGKKYRTYIRQSSLCMVLTEMKIWGRFAHHLLPNFFMSSLLAYLDCLGADRHCLERQRDPSRIILKHIVTQGGSLPASYRSGVVRSIGISYSLFDAISLV
jgi:hypothetical protein